MKVSKTVLISILVISGLSLAIAILMYIGYIGTQGVSKAPAHWGQFGDFFGLFVNIINTLGLLVLSYMLYKLQAKEHIPLLRFIAWEGRTYRLYNMGRGPAHKVVIGKRPGQNSAIDTPTYKGYSIPPGTYLVIDWATNAQKLFAYYEDDMKNTYLVTCESDENEDNKDENIIKFLLDNKNRKDKIQIQSY